MRQPQAQAPSIQAVKVKYSPRVCFPLVIVGSASLKNSSLLLRNILQNIETLDLFTINIKSESIYKSYYNGTWRLSKRRW